MFGSGCIGSYLLCGSASVGHVVQVGWVEVGNIDEINFYEINFYEINFDEIDLYYINLDEIQFDSESGGPIILLSRAMMCVALMLVLR